MFLFAVPMKNCIHMINDNFKIHEDYSELVEFLESKSTENTGVGRSAEPFQVIGMSFYSSSLC